MENGEGSNRLEVNRPAQAARGIHPLMTIGLASAWPIFVALHTEPFSGSAAERLAMSAGLAEVPSLLAFGLAYLIALRRASLRWKLSALPALYLVAVLANFISVSLSAPEPGRSLAPAASLDSTSR